MFKRYRATKENVILLESAMKALGYPLEKVSAATDYKSFKHFNWHIMFHNVVNQKMQELEGVSPSVVSMKYRLEGVSLQDEGTTMQRIEDNLDKLMEGVAIDEWSCTIWVNGRRISNLEIYLMRNGLNPRNYMRTV